jgi:hypothetical protein
MAQRPPHQRWIKRPPKPSRTSPHRAERIARPGMAQFLTAIGFGLACGILGGVLGPVALPRPGMGGLFAGLGFVLGFIILWRGQGGTRQDLRNLFR